ncbi:MAG: hypothetical protein IPI00_17790 [Flavobacteriales bacterium]|nr:hypothetical protein [Flavobacteriales bacterium]
MFLFVVPRLNAIDSLHPGNGGNSGFNDLDLDQRLRTVFYLPVWAGSSWAFGCTTFVYAPPPFANT